MFFFFYCSGDHRDLHVLTHSFPTRRSSDLLPRPPHRRPRPVRGNAFERSSRRRPARHRRGADRIPAGVVDRPRSEEHTSELQSLMRISYAVFCLKKKKENPQLTKHTTSYDSTYTNNTTPKNEAITQT